MGYIKFDQKVELVAFAILVCAAPIYAECNVSNRVVFACTLENSQKQLTICLKDREPSPTIVYQMSKPNGSIEFELERKVTEINYENYGYKGQDAIMDMTFHYGAYEYQVGATHHNFFDDEGNYTGGVTVEKGNTTIAEVTCKPSTIRMDDWELPLTVLQDMGYEWCPAWGTFEFDEMRYVNCGTGEIGFDQVTGEPGP